LVRLGPLYRVRRQYELSGASMGLTAGLALGLAAARNEVHYLVLLILLMLVLGLPVGIVSWRRGGHAVEFADPAPPGWLPPTGGMPAWLAALPLPGLIVVAFVIGGWHNEDQLVVIGVVFAIGGLLQAAAIARAEARSGMVLVSKSTWRTEHPLLISPAELARLESRPAASGAAR
jgi:hypothetical protein